MSEPVRRKIKELEVMVAEVIYETPDTRTLVFFTGNDPLEYKPGHFLTIAPQQFSALERWTSYLEHLKGRKEPPRAYSMSSCPQEKYLAITIKEERYIPGVTPFPPLLSPIPALRTAQGTRMVITGFTGPYTLPDDMESKTSCAARLRGQWLGAGLQHHQRQPHERAEAAAHARLQQQKLGRLHLCKTAARFAKTISGAISHGILFNA